MEKIKELPLKQKVLLGVGVVIFAIILFYPDDEPASQLAYQQDFNQQTHQQGVQPSQDSQNQRSGTFFSRFGSGRGQQITIFDRGVQMEMARVTIPASWNLQYDIYTNPQTGTFDRYISEYSGPEGESIRTFGSELFGDMYGQSFDQALRRALQNTLRGEIQNLTTGSLQRSESLLRSKSYNELVQAGFPADPLEIEIKGSRNGRPVHGLFQIVKSDFPSMGFGGQNGMIMTQLILAPENRLDRTMETYSAIELSYERNPQFTQRVQQISQAYQQQSQQNHQQRMAAQRNQFAEQNRQWSENFFGTWNTGSTSAGSGYSSNDQFLDAITGYSTFDDPHTGFQRRVEGHYQYNFTDGMGNYYGTNAPTFDHRSLQGNWQPINPLRPNN